MIAFLAHRTDIKEDTYPQLWELLSAAEDAGLNSLPEMELSPEKLMQMLKDTKGENGAPFGCLRTRMSLCEGWFAWSCQMLSMQTYLTDIWTSSTKWCSIAAAELAIVLHSPS